MLQHSMVKTDIRCTVRRFGIALVVLLFAEWGGAQAQEPAMQGWNHAPSITSGGLAQAGCQLLGTTGLGWSDGRQAIITFWHCSNGDTVRCLDYFSAEMAPTGGQCDFVPAQK
jgi:hypothetical protein